MPFAALPRVATEPATHEATQNSTKDPSLSDFLTDHGVVVALVCAGLAVLYGALTTRSLLALSPGNERMQEISGAVQQGARAYLNRQYTVIAGVGVVIFIALIPIQNLRVAVGFLIGGILSGATGYIGMNVSVRANAPAAASRRRSTSRSVRARSPACSSWAWR